MKVRNKIILLIFVLFLIGSFIADKGEAQASFPNKANYFLNWSINNSQAEELAKWDLLILDMELQRSSLSQLKKIRQLNPDIIILAYITPQEIKKDASSSSSALRRNLASGIKQQWYLQNSSGSKLSWWTGTYLLNVTNSNFQDYLVDFVVNELLDSNLWDGVYYDNAWDSITNFAGSNIDYNLDGKTDTSLDSKWATGMKNIYNQTRVLAGGDIVIVGNGTTAEYTAELNGKMLENFLSAFWTPTMDRYKANSNAQKPSINIINSNTSNSGLKSYKNMRFGLGSTLLEDGYFAYDYGDTNHGQTWWYDEYDVDLGEALGESVSQNNYNTYQPDVWQRDFSNGLALVNSTASKQTVELGGDYEKIHGTQDSEINDGSIISETVIDGYDGLILLKTLASLNDVVFRNGDFVRFLDANGNRVRNGFFVFEDGYKGGDKVAHIDLDGNGKRDLLVVSRNKMMAWRDDGQIFMKVYPYTTSYHGELRVAVGDLNADGFSEIYVGPSDGYPMPLKVYTRHGRKMRRDYYPFGESYTGGFYLGTGDIDGGPYNTDELLIGAGLKSQPKVQAYNFTLDKLHEWLAYEYWFTGGVPVAGGDVDGDGIDEIIVGAGPGKKPVVRIFDKSGTQLYDEFSVYSSMGTPGVEVLSVDVDFDGRDDVVGMSGGF